ncbi:MAG: DUF1294 domain-containing protein [bacterium]|jgi:uncharacterized membrane protein YsdA (DUF1294 family)|nr:DUF1294 domain-containing protein [bacterium]
MILRQIDKRILSVWFVLVIGLTATGIYTTTWPPIVVLLATTNVVTYLAMMLDKIQATQRGGRLSERSLYIMTFLGGSIGMALAIQSLRHKSKKTSFQLVVAVLVLLQLFLVYSLTDLVTLSL